MKKSICLLLALVMVLGLCACGSAKVENTESGVEVTVPTPEPTAEPTPEPTPTPEPPFAVKAGLVFTAPHGYDGLLSGQISTVPESVFHDVEYSITAPVITRTPTEGKDAYVTYTVEYAIEHFGVNFDFPAAYTKTYRFFATYLGYRLYDYYSGVEFPSRGLYLDESNQKDGYEYSDPVILHGEQSYEIFCAKTAASEVLHESASAGHHEKFFTHHITIIAVVPEDYDGLMIGIPYKYEQENSIVDQIETNSSLDTDTVEYWDDQENVDKWEFVRLSDYA